MVNLRGQFSKAEPVFTRTQSRQEGHARRVAAIITSVRIAGKLFLWNAQIDEGGARMERVILVGSDDVL